MKTTETPQRVFSLVILVSHPRKFQMLFHLNDSHSQTTIILEDLSGWCSEEQKTGRGLYCRMGYRVI